MEIYHREILNKPLIGMFFLYTLMAGCSSIDEDRNPRENELGNSFVDIVPSREESNVVDYCRKENGQLLVSFTNSGNIPSLERNVSVEFFTRNGRINRQDTIPSISAGGNTNILFDIPGRCFSPDCNFSINWGREPVFGRCIG